MFEKLCFCKQKNNERSLSARTAGNSKLFQNDYEGALQMYNESVRFAQDSEHLSLAYANRSYCFMKIDLFDRCMTDIQNALNNHYPEHLVPKLIKRKQICLLKLTKRKHLSYVKPELSYDSNLNLQCFASVLKVEVSEKFGRLIKAECDIRIGETLSVEKAYVRVATANECYNCTEKKSNFVPCPNCVDVMFCSEKCAQDVFHTVECNVVFHSDESLGVKSSSFVLRSIMTGISTFSTIEEMMHFVNCQLNDPEAISQSLATPESRYRSFFNLSSFGKIRYVRDQASSIFLGMMHSKRLFTKFETLEKQRFLAHLICHHALIIRTNAFGGLCNPPDEVSENPVHTIENFFERNVFLGKSYFNHSCLPNVTKLSKDNLAVVKAIQSIKKGQQLFVTYLAGELTERTSEDRNNELESIYGFRCECELCISGVRTVYRSLESDNDFLYVVSNVKNFQILNRQIKECCILFLLKHSDKLASEPGYFILNTLTSMLQKELEQ